MCGRVASLARVATCAEQCLQLGFGNFALFTAVWPADFMAAYNFASRHKTLSGLTPYEYIAKIWTSEPVNFIVDPIYQMAGLNN